MLPVARVREDTDGVEGLREETPCGGREDDVHDLRLREPEIAERLQLGIADRRRVVDDALRKAHHGDVDVVEARIAVVASDLGHRLAELVLEDAAVSERAIARPEPPRGRQRGQLVASNVHPRLDCPVQSTPGGIHLRAFRECTLEVRGHLVNCAVFRRLVEGRQESPLCTSDRLSQGGRSLEQRVHPREILRPQGYRPASGSAVGRVREPYDAFTTVDLEQFDHR